MLKIGNFTCQEHISFLKSTLVLLNCYHVVLRSDFEKALRTEDTTCLRKCAEFDAERVVKLNLFGFFPFECALINFNFDSNSTDKRC